MDCRSAKQTTKEKIVCEDNAITHSPSMQAVLLPLADQGHIELAAASSTADEPSFASVLRDIGQGPCVP